MYKKVLLALRGAGADVEEMYRSLTPERQEHGEEVAQLTGKLLLWAAEDLAQDYPDRTLLTQAAKAARYYNIGLALLPDRLLSKIEGLTAAEVDVIRRHAEYGGTLLDNYRKAHATSLEENRFWSLAAEIALGHHERWDGKGYPFGQMTTGVPGYVRAVAIASAYVSMVRGSCYRMALTAEYALLELVHNAARQFDPFLVEVLERHFDSIL